MRRLRNLFGLGTCGTFSSTKQSARIIMGFLLFAISTLGHFPNVRYTTEISEKHIQSMTKLKFTVSRDFHKLARLLKNISGASELLFGPYSPLSDIMLYKWKRFLTKTVGSMLATLEQLAHKDALAVSRQLGGFIEKTHSAVLATVRGS